MTRTRSLFAIAACLLAAPSAQAILIDVAGNDVETGYTAGSGNLTTGAEPAVGTSAFWPVFEGALIDFSITLVSQGGPGSWIFGSTWAGGSAGADLTIVDEVTSEVLLELEINSIEGGTANPGGAGGANTSFTLGSIDELDPKSDLDIVGGSLAANFGGIGGKAHLSLLVSQLSVPIGDAFGTGVLNQSFTGTTNLQLGFVATPEPGTAMLLGTALLGLAGWRRSQKP